MICRTRQEIERTMTQRPLGLTTFWWVRSFMEPLKFTNEVLIMSLLLAFQTEPPMDHVNG